MRRQIVRWAVMAIAVPVVAAGAKKLADTLEERRGPSSKIARGIRKAGEKLRPTKD